MHWHLANKIPPHWIQNTSFQDWKCSCRSCGKLKAGRLSMSRKLSSKSLKVHDSDMRNDTDYIRQHPKEQLVCTWPAEETGREQAPEIICLESVSCKDECIDVALISQSLIRAGSFSWVWDPAWCSILPNLTLGEGQMVIWLDLVQVWNVEIQVLEMSVENYLQHHITSMSSDSSLNINTSGSLPSKRSYRCRKTSRKKRS